MLVAAICAREVLAGHNWRNLPIIAILVVLIGGNAAFHAEHMLTGTADLGVRIGMCAGYKVRRLGAGRWRAIANSPYRTLGRGSHVARAPSPYPARRVCICASRVCPRRRCFVRCSRGERGHSRLDGRRDRSHDAGRDDASEPWTHRPRACRLADDTDYLSCGGCFSARARRCCARRQRIHGIAGAFRRSLGHGFLGLCSRVRAPSLEPETNCIRAARMKSLPLLLGLADASA
jgi:hypothetical protein